MQKIMQKSFGALLMCWLLLALVCGAQAQNGTTFGSTSFPAAKFNTGLNAAPGTGIKWPIGGSPFEFGNATSWTIEFWMKKAAAPSSLAVICGYSSNFWFGINTDGTLRTDVIGSPATPINVCTNAWVHVAEVYNLSTTTFTVYVGGAVSGTTTATYAQAASPTTIPAFGAGFNTVNGTPSTTFDTTILVDELRVSTVARYNAPFTPPTAPFDPNVASSKVYHIDGDANQAGVTPPLVAAGNVQVVGATPTAITVTAPTTGGTAPLAYVWQRATLTGSTIGTYATLSNGAGVSGATTATLTDASPSLVAKVLYAYKCTVTDSASTPVVLTTFSRLVPLGLTPIVIAAAGDSTSAGIAGVSNNTTMNPSYIGQSPLDNCAAILRTVKGYRNVTAINGAVPGSTASSWAASATSNGFTYLPDLLASCGGSFSGVYVFVRLGVNDAQGGLTAANYLANMTTVVNYITTRGGIVLLSYPTWREPGLYGQDGATQFSEAYTSTLLSYLPQIDSLVNNTTVFAGDKISLGMEMANPQAYMYYAPGNATTGQPGTIHENALGTLLFGTNDAQALLTNVLYPATSSVKILKTSRQSPRNSRN